jgi:hypothetical protein
VLPTHCLCAASTHTHTHVNQNHRGMSIEVVAWLASYEVKRMPLPLLPVAESVGCSVQANQGTGGEHGTRMRIFCLRALDFANHQPGRGAQRMEEKGAEAASDDGELDEDHISKEGVLKKLVKPRFFRQPTWKARYFELRNGTLRWYSLKGEDRFSLMGASVDQDEAGDLVVLRGFVMGHRFSLALKDQDEPVVLAAASKIDADLWIQHLKALSTGIVSSAHSPSPGFLYHMGGKAWQKRCAVLCGSELVLTTMKRKGFYELIQMRALVDNSNPTCFSLESVSDDSRPLLTVACDSEASCSAWVEAITSASEHESKIESVQLDGEQCECAVSPLTKSLFQKENASWSCAK